MSLVNEARKLARWLVEAELLYVSQVSASSSSRYFIVRVGDDDVKIRIADHDLPPTWKSIHGEADYEVGKHFEATHDNVADLVVDLCSRAGRPVPRCVKAAVARAELKRRAFEKARKACEREDAARRSLASKEADRVLEEAPNELAKLMLLRGEKRRVRIRALEARLGLETMEAVRLAMIRLCTNG